MKWIVIMTVVLSTAVDQTVSAQDFFPCGFAQPTPADLNLSACVAVDANNDGTTDIVGVRSQGEPSCTCEKYLMLYASGWNDTNSTARPWAIMEYSGDCNGDGLVDFGQIRAGTLLDQNVNGVPDCCEAGQPCTPTCAGDIVLTGVVDSVDLAALLSAWETSGGDFPRADIDQSGLVDGGDLGLLLVQWGVCQ